MVSCYRGSMIPWYSGTMVQGGEETVPELWKLFPRGWRPVKMHTNEHPVPQTIGKMQVVGSKLCKRAERGCNLSKRFMSRGGAAPPSLALAEIASSLPALLHSLLPTTCILSMFTVTRVLVCMYFYGSPPSLGTVSSRWEEFPHPPVL